MNEKNAIEQDLARLRDITPRIYWSIYQGCLATGFNPIQSFVLLQTWILSQCPNGIQPSSTQGPNTDTE